MNCEIIKDLIPLYIDDCCSEESTALVKEHLEKCPQCNSLYESMKTPDNFVPVAAPSKKLKVIDSWKASVLQSVLLFVSFAVITVGVALEASTSYLDAENGGWAFSVVIPATAFLLSLANWYFVKFYKNKKAFSNCSWLATLGFAIGADIWAIFHYEIDLAGIVAEIPNMSTADFFEFLFLFALISLPELLITAFFCALSKFTSYKFATMVGKE